MALPSGWNPNQSGQYTQNKFLSTSPGGSKIKIIVNTSPITGNFVVSDANGDPIYSYDANGGISVSNAEAYESLFTGTHGSKNLENTNKNTKNDTLNIAEEVAPDNVEGIEKTTQYKSQSNTDSQYQPSNPPPPSPTPTNNNLNDTNKLIKGISGTATPGATSGTGLVYPVNRNPRQDYIMFTSVDRCNNIFEKCSLPIQGGIADNNAVDFAGGKLSPLQSGVAELATNAIEGKSLEGPTKKGKDSIKTDIDALGGAVASSAAAALVGVSQDELLARFKGAVVNPNLQLLFKGPTLRPFSFTFTLSPRSKAEAVIVKRIVRFFKFNMAVQKTEGQLFLEEPRTFRIQYINGDNPEAHHAGLNKIKRCALQACNVDYTPAGTYSRFNDGAGTMTQYKIGLQFQEIEPIYSGDYENHTIGF